MALDDVCCPTTRGQVLQVLLRRFGHLAPVDRRGSVCSCSQPVSPAESPSIPVSDCVGDLRSDVPLGAGGRRQTSDLQVHDRGSVGPDPIRIDPLAWSTVNTTAAAPFGPER